jgi:choline dehydrogenase
MEAFDVVVVGGGTAGCVLAARLSEDAARTVCLLEAGPDHGPFRDGGWPDDLLDPRYLPDSHDWGSGGEDARSLGARVLGGSSAHNACMMVVGPPGDYDAWGPAWAWSRFAPFVARAGATLGVQRANTEQPVPFHEAFREAVLRRGFPAIDDASDPAQPVGVTTIPANVADGVRWNAAFAYLDPARGRGNLHVRGSTLVDRLVVDGGRVRGVVLADGGRVDAPLVVLTAGAYLTAALLLRSGIGPEEELRRHGIEPLAILPVGATLLDHCGAGFAWEPSSRLLADTRAHVAEHGEVFEPHMLLKAASSGCDAGGWDLHVLSWLYRDQAAETYMPTIGVFHLQPRPAGCVRLASTDPTALPHVERGFLVDDRDLDELVEGLEIARAVAGTEPFRGLLGVELRPGRPDRRGSARGTVRNYYHPAGTCPLGRVVDDDGRVLGLEGVVVADASLMPTLPRANTNWTTAAIAERIATTL